MRGGLIGRFVSLWDNQKMTPIPQNQDFSQEWNSLGRRDRLRIRRLIRMGKPLADRNEASLAVSYGRFQRTRLWARSFWFWFAPGLVFAIGVAARIHPVIVGVVLALATQALFARRNLGRVETVNASLLNPQGPQAAH